MTTSHSKHILIASDDLELWSLAGLVLTEQGHRVSHAVTGKQAIDLHRRAPLDLVVVELGLKGFESLTELRKRPFSVKFITTSHTTRLSVELCERIGEHLGAHCFMAKPLSSERLLAAINSALG
ncbi:MAG: response regulator [Verrucomicrobiota bacterium]